MILTDDGESIGLFEPLLVSQGAKSRSRLNELAQVLAAKSAALSGSFPSPMTDALVDLIRITDCFYSNGIEGHFCQPVDIDRAMRGEYSADEDIRAFQLEARAHIAAQSWIDNGGIAAQPFSVEAVCQVHKRFCELLPTSLLAVDGPDGGLSLSMEPGAIRTVGVRVGRHVAVSAGAVPRFLARIERAYRSTGQIDGILSAACGHHRLLWVHPFLDSNGRVARLVSYAALRNAIGSKCLWSFARGLGRREQEYKAHLQSCDEPRRGSLDGRGSLSEGALAAFVEYYLTTCIDEVDFMAELLQPFKLRDRVRTWGLGQLRIGRFPPGSDALLAALVRSGRLDRAEVAILIGATDGLDRQLITALVESGIVQSDDPHSPLRLSFPTKLVDQLLPGLLPRQSDVARSTRETS